MSAFRVGQKVVCVDDKGQTRAPFVRRGDVYTVSRAYDYFLIGMCLEFSEFPVTPKDCVFPAKYFRPAVDQFDFNKLVTPAELEKFKLDERAPKSNPLKVSP